MFLYWHLSSLMVRLSEDTETAEEYLPASHHEGSRTRLPVNVFPVQRLSELSRLLTFWVYVTRPAHKLGSSSIFRTVWQTPC